MSRPPVLVVAGPTATGKTAAAVELARYFDGELVGADSVQVYRGFDIGSAKPTAADLQGVPHHLLDILDPCDDIDAAAYAQAADVAIAAVHARRRLPIVVGGTGLWIRALLRGLVELPPVDSEVRARLEAEARANGGGALYARLREVDPLAAEAVHPNDALRIVRALEVWEQTGVPLGQLRLEHALGSPRYRTVFTVLDMERAAHDELVTKRVQEMIDAGWVDEVSALRERWGDEVRPLGSVGYREIVLHLRDDVPLEDTKRLIRKSTRTYAKRQRTWFKGETGVSWTGEREQLVDERGRERLKKELGV